MAVSKQLREDLLKAMGDITPRRLNQVASARAQELLITHEQAVYAVAHEHGLRLSKYLTREEQAEMRAILAQHRAQAAPAAPTSNGTTSRKSNAPKPALVTIAGVNVEMLPGMTATHAKEAKMMAEKVYPTLYVFENSVRDVIERVLKAEFGADWWTKAVPGKVQTAAKDTKTAEKKDPWHSQRGAREIDYVLLSHLWDIIKHQWKYFKDLFPNQAWTETLITSDMNVSRRVLAHMTPLTPDDVKNIEAAFRKWANQLKAVESKLP